MGSCGEVFPCFGDHNSTVEVRVGMIALPLGLASDGDLTANSHTHFVSYLTKDSRWHVDL